MNEDPTKSLSHEDRNGLREEVHSMSQRLQRVEEKLDEHGRENRSMSERLDQILTIVVGTRRELREANRRLRHTNISLSN